MANSLSSLSSSLTSTAVQNAFGNGISNVTNALVSTAYEQRAKKLGQQASSAQVKVSALGQVSASVSKVRDSASALQDSTKTTNTQSGAAKALSSFVQAVNSQNKTVASLTGSTTATAASSTSSNTSSSAATGGSLSGEYRVQAAGAAVNSAVQSNSQQLANLGISVQSDGSLKLDENAFNASYKANPTAVKTALADLGQSVATAAGKQLSEGGSLASASKSAQAVADNYTARQSELQAQYNNNQQALVQAQQTSNTIGARVAAQLSSYQSVFSL